MLLLGVVLAWAVFAVAARTEPLVSNRWNVALVTAPLACLAALASGLSTATVYDRRVYSRHFEHLGLVGSPGDLPRQATDPLFDYLLWGLARLLPTTQEVLFTAIGLIVSAGLLWAFSRVLPAWAVLGAFLTVIASGLFAAYTGVVVRQGLAVAALLPALVLAATRRRTGVMFVLLTCAGLLHWTAVAPALAVVAVRFLGLRLKALVAGWAALAVTYVLGAQQRLLGGLGARLAQLDDYTDPSLLLAYRGGVNRLDFLALSAAILIAALIARRWVGEDSVYDRLVAGYVLFSGVFLLFGFIAFSDRLASYSWFVAPLLVWYALARWAPDRAAFAPVGALLGVLALGVYTGTWASLAAVAI